MTTTTTPSFTDHRNHFFRDEHGSRTKVLTSKITTTGEYRAIIIDSDELTLEQYALARGIGHSRLAAIAALNAYMEGLE